MTDPSRVPPLLVEKAINLWGEKPLLETFIQRRELEFYPGEGWEQNESVTFRVENFENTVKPLKILRLK